LLDIGLPDFKGYEIARQLRWEGGLEKARIIAVTGLAGDDVKERCLAAGCEAFYKKPVSPAALEKLLASTKQE
jgi:CheY-like chemotaxis protein